MSEPVKKTALEAMYDIAPEYGIPQDEIFAKISSYQEQIPVQISNTLRDRNFYTYDEEKERWVSIDPVIDRKLEDIHFAHINAGYKSSGHGCC